MATELAAAYITLMPSLKGASSSISKQLGGIDLGGVDKKLGNKLSAGVSEAFGNAEKGITSRMTAGAVAMGNILSQAITSGASAMKGIFAEAYSGFAQYEQLSGGVKKLYGTTAQSVEDYAKSVGASVKDVRADYANLQKAEKIVMDNAQMAYATAGMSANKYMEQATGFSAALIKSLGGDTVKAAELTDVAMRAISDNYNTFGGDMGNITHAFQGFAKQNYTMLDNLSIEGALAA